MAETDPIVPPMVYVPCAASAVEGADVGVLVRRARDGCSVLLVYTALDRLVACCGGEQPWVLVPTASLEVAVDGGPPGMILLDVEIPTHARHGAS